MIPHEILKKIRQIELRTDRIVTEFAAGARVCDPQRSRITYNRNSFGALCPAKLLRVTDPRSIRRITTHRL